MSVGLLLKGSIRGKADIVLTRIGRYFHERYGAELMGIRLSDDGVLSLRLHPAAEDVEVRVSGGELVVSASTSGAGPGYHAELCEALAEVGKALEVRWAKPADDEGDETGYFTTHDRAALEQSMLTWLSALAKVVLVHLGEGKAQGPVALSMPTTTRFHGPEGAAVLTQVGPRSKAWLEAVAADGRKGIDFFPWWEPGRGAAYDLGRAMVHLHCDVRFHAAATDDEEKLGRELLARLARAYKADPKLDYPWAAWQSLHDDVVGADADALPAIVRKNAKKAGPNAVGYRLHDVDVELPGGWRITVPGSYSAEVDDDGAMSLWEDDRCIEATAFRREQKGKPLPAAKALPSDPMEGKALTLTGLKAPHRAASTSFELDGERFTNVTAQIAADGMLLMVTAIERERKTATWARKVLATVVAP